MSSDMLGLSSRVRLYSLTTPLTISGSLLHRYTWIKQRVNGEELKRDIDPHNNWLRKNKGAKVTLMQLVAATFI